MAVDNSVVSLDSTAYYSGGMESVVAPDGKPETVVGISGGTVVKGVVLGFGMSAVADAHSTYEALLTEQRLFVSRLLAANGE
jgi:hypothetical protein